MAYEVSQKTYVEAYVSAASIPGVTGDGTNYGIVCDQVQADFLGEYNTTTGVFMPLSSGVYTFNMRLCITNILATNTNLVLSLLVGPSTLAFFEFYTPFPIISADTSVYSTSSITLYLSAGDQYIIDLTVQGNATPNIDIVGSNLSIPFLTGLSITRND